MWNRKGTKRDESAQKAIRDHRDTIANETCGTARMPDDAMLEALLRAEFDKDAHHTDAAAHSQSAQNVGRQQGATGIIQALVDQHTPKLPFRHTDTLYHGKFFLT